MLDGGKKLKYSVDADGKVTVNLPKGTKPQPVALKFKVK